MSIDRPLYVNIVGFIALGMSLAYRIPQMYKLYKTGSGKDISTWMIHVQNVSYALYIVYGIFIEDLVYIISSTISLLQNFIILIMICCFNRKEQVIDI